MRKIEHVVGVEFVVVEWIGRFDVVEMSLFVVEMDAVGCLCIVEELVAFEIVTLVVDLVVELIGNWVAQLEVAELEFAHFFDRCWQVFALGGNAFFVVEGIYLLRKIQKFLRNLIL